MKRGMNSSEMQKKNRRLVFQTLLDTGGMTRTELASELNLQKATITNIINEFYEMGIVRVKGDTAAGRRGEKICLILDDIYLMSIGITRIDYQLCIFAFDGKEIEQIHCSFDTNDSFRAILDNLKTDAFALMQKHGAQRIIKVCIAVPGLFINRPEKNEEIFMVSEFDALSKYNVRQELEQVLGKRIIAKHDAKLSAYAEWRCAEELKGIERGSLAVIRSRGYGIGTGFVVNGAIMNGHLGLAGEVGYMGINYNGSHDKNRKSGTFEYYAGTESATRYLKERLYEFPDSPLSENSTYNDIIEAYRNDDPLAIWIVEKIALMLGYGIANIIYVVNPDCIIIGQDYPDTEHFLRRVRESIKRCVPEYVEAAACIRYSKLNHDSFLLGAYYYMLEQCLSDENIISIICEAKRTN